MWWRYNRNMDTIGFKTVSGDKILAVKDGKELSFSDEELLRLWMFDNHVKRLVSFAEPLYKEMSFSISIPPKGRNDENNIPTELRLSALINELRPFMLKKDPIFFLDIRKIIGKQFCELDTFNKCMHEYKRMWLGYDINSISENSVKMQVVHQIDKEKITTYAQLLRIFIYGKYIHNDKNLKYAALVERIEYGPYYSGVRADLGVCIGDICNILRAFNTDFVRPILEQYIGVIKQLNWESLNSKSTK